MLLATTHANCDANRDAHGDTYCDCDSPPNANANRDTLSDCNSDRPAYSNADTFRLPPRGGRLLPFAIAISNSAHHSDTNADAAANAKPDSDAFARASSGLEYFDAIAR